MPKKKTTKKATSRSRVKGRTTKKARAKSSPPKTPVRKTKRKKAAPAPAAKRSSKKKPPAVRVDSVWQSELARIFGTTARNVQRWTEQGMPRHDDGTYPLKECVAWRRERDRDEARPRNLVDAQFRKAAGGRPPDSGENSGGDRRRGPRSSPPTRRWSRVSGAPVLH